MCRHYNGTHIECGNTAQALNFQVGNLKYTRTYENVLRCAQPLKI